jgi:hypothetical protein
MKTVLSLGFVFSLLIGILALVGWIKCLIKFIDCDFKPSYKAEVIYGVGTITGLGAIIGWVDIEDTPDKVETLEKLQK